MFKKQRARYREARAIRSAIDTYPGGICFAASDGRPILSNRGINAVCLRLTGQTITNARAMWEELERRSVDGDSAGRKGRGPDLLLCRLPDGAVWQFQRRPLEIDGTIYTQYEASDITVLYEYQNRLRENNTRAAELHKRQRELLQNIVQNNVNKELLRAKVGIHDDFGRLLIMTKNALAENREEAESPELFSAWENVIADMENAAADWDTKAASPEQELVQVADMIGCRVEFHGRQPSERKALLLLYAAIREALTNAVRHAGADKLTIAIEEKNGEYSVEIRNNGRTDVTDLREGGGLGDLRKRLEQEGAGMTILCDGSVTMKLTIPKE